VTSVIRRPAFACLALVLLACGSAGGSTTAKTPEPSPSASARPMPTLSAADLAEVAQLEKRPLKTPKPASDGQCHQGPFTPDIVPYANGNDESEVYGAGPVYGAGSPPIASGRFLYYAVTYFTAPSVHGAVLVRIHDLSGKYVGRFAGPYAIGPTVSVDPIQGTLRDVHEELALPADDPPANSPAAASGWGVFHVLQGIDNRFTCAAIQIDTAAGTEVILGH